MLSKYNCQSSEDFVLTRKNNIRKTGNCPVFSRKVLKSPPSSVAQNIADFDPLLLPRIWSGIVLILEIVNIITFPPKDIAVLGRISKAKTTETLDPSKTCHES